jgi:hypothetical protein
MTDPNKYIIVQSWDTGLTGSRVYQNASTVPNTGNFPALELWQDTSGAGIGRFSDAPDESMVYCNGKDSCVWAGAEYRCAGFILEDSTGATMYDYTDQINNTLDDAPNIAVLSLTPAYVYVASTRPIRGAKFYVKTANTNAATVAVSYWLAGSWHSVSLLSDGTVPVAKPKFKSKTYAYWYRFVFTGISATTSVYYVTVDAPFQKIVDLWDGNPRTITSAFSFFDGVFYDVTTHLLKQDFAGVSDQVCTIVLNSFSPSDYFLLGFAERMTAIEFIMPTLWTNVTASVMSIYYWDGTTWVAVTGLIDNTSTSGISFSKSGIACWDSPNPESEFKSSHDNKEFWYYYKVQFSVEFDRREDYKVLLDQVIGIPAQKSIHGYSYPVLWQNRIWLLNDNSKNKNGAICSSQDTVCVFNGDDAFSPDDPILFGNDDEIVAGATLYTRFGPGIFDNLIVLKRKEIWLVDGTNPSDYKKYRIADSFGCVAPGTLKSCQLGYEITPGLVKHVLIWQSDNAMVLFDGNSVVPISEDISNYFDKTKAECIPDSMKANSEGFYDPFNYEYHWLFASGAGQTTLNKEFVYDLLKKKMFEVDRGTGNYLQMGFFAKDSIGNTYSFGGLDTGYIERLEFGTTFDNTNIISTLRIGDIPLGGWQYKSEIRHLKHIAVSKSTTTNSVTLTHYGDSGTVSSKTISHAVKNTIQSTVQKVEGVNWGNYTFHSIQAVLITSDENCGYEPIGLEIRWRPIREDIL